MNKERTENYTGTVIIDGLIDKERGIVRDELKRLKIKYRKIRGMKDEQSVFLRLADAMAGFLCEVTEGKEYEVSLAKLFKSSKFIT